MLEAARIFEAFGARLLHQSARMPFASRTITGDTNARKRAGALCSSRGQAFVETGIAIIVLLGFVFSVVDAGMLFWTYVTLENAVSEGTRFAVTNQTLADPNNPGNQLSRIDSIKLKTRTEANGIPLDDGEFVFANLTDGTADAGGPNDVIRVGLNHPYKPLFPVLFSASSLSFNIHLSSTMMNEPPAT